MKESLPDIICNTALNLCFREAAHGDRFRQYFYPRLPRCYEVNPKVKEHIRTLMLKGKSAKEIFEIIKEEVG